MILAGWLGAAALGGGLYGVAQAGSEFSAEFEKELGSTDWQAALEEAAKSNE